MAFGQVDKKELVEWGNRLFRALRRDRFSPSREIGGAVMAYVLCVTARRNGFTIEKVLELVKRVWDLAGEVEPARIQRPG